METTVRRFIDLGSLAAWDGVEYNAVRIYTVWDVRVARQAPTRENEETRGRPKSQNNIHNALLSYPVVMAP